EFGLVAVVVGVLVGGAVRKGSNGRGGWRYQLLAMFLTYSAVVVTDSSLIARELKKELGTQAASPAAVADGVSASTDAAPSTSHRPAPLAVVFGLTLIIALAYAAPSRPSAARGAGRRAERRVERLGPGTRPVTDRRDPAQSRRCPDRRLESITGRRARDREAGVTVGQRGGGCRRTRRPAPQVQI